MRGLPRRLAGHCVDDAIGGLFRSSGRKVGVDGGTGGQQAENQQFQG